MGVKGVCIASLHTKHQRARHVATDPVTGVEFQMGPIVFTHCGYHERIGDAGRAASSANRMAACEF